MSNPAHSRFWAWSRRIALVLTLGYPLSLYPVFWIYRAAVPPNRRPAAISPVIDKFYWPLERIIAGTPTPVRDVLNWANNLVP
jgi:hypothetical protein